MQTRESLITEIETFVSNAINLSNTQGIVDKIGYFDLDKRILSLNENDFENKDKYIFFLNFIQQGKRQAEKFAMESSFQDNYLNIPSFLWMCNYLEGVASKLR